MTDDITKAAEAPIPFWRSLHADALAHVPPDKRAALRGGPVWLLLKTLLTSSGLRCALLYRLSYMLRRVPIVGVLASKVLYWIGRHWYGCAIAGTARIAGGLILPHPIGIVVGSDVRIGERAWIFQHVTIGGSPNKTGMPCIGNNARLYAGAVLVGPISVGDDVIVGANAVVSCDVPDRSQVRATRSEVAAQ